MILVTGATGLVGRHLLDLLSRKRTPLRALYRTADRVEEVATFFDYKNNPHFETIDWVKADITNIPDLDDAFKGITQVYHCAALISFDPYQYRKMRQVNMYGTENVVNLCLKHQVQKLVHISSIATLGKPLTGLITEDDFYNPDADNSVYAITKNAAEMEVWRGTQEGLDAVILNPGVIIGEGSYDTGSGLLFARCKNGLKRYPAGSTGVVSVEDVVNAALFAMIQPIVNERYILVAANWSYLRLLTTICSALHKRPPSKIWPRWMLGLAWRLDAVWGLLLRKRRLTRNSVEALMETSSYDNTKAKEELQLSFETVEQTIHRVACHFQQEVS